jgi:hypothetical protein
MEINLFDTAFDHLITPDGRYSHVFSKQTKYTTYTRNQQNYSGITLFTDNLINSGIAPQITSKYKIGWLLESRELHPHFYTTFDSYKDHYDFVLTHDPELLSNYPTKTKKYLIGGCWTAESNWKLHNKTKLISMIYSGRQQLTGHKLRHTIANRFTNSRIDYFGHGTSRPLVNKEDGLQDYHFSIIIENSKQLNYFTEKIIDCLTVGTIPIYWGCPNISEFFNTNGFIHFNSIKELDDILASLTPELYQSKLQYARENLELAKQYAVTEDWLYKNIFAKLD